MDQDGPAGAFACNETDLTAVLAPLQHEGDWLQKSGCNIAAPAPMDIVQVRLIHLSDPFPPNESLHLQVHDFVPPCAVPLQDQLDKGESEPEAPLPSTVVSAHLLPHANALVLQAVSYIS